MSSRSCLLSAVALFGLAGPAPAQLPSPLDLVQGIRESGSPDLAMEYLKEVEEKLKANPNLLPEVDRQAIPLERSQCLLALAEDESDEGTRTSMINEAKQGFNAFIVAAPKHPRLAEAALAVAKLTSVEAKAQLNRARRIEIPPIPADGPDKAEKERERDAAIAQRQAEANKARPLFLLASQRFGEAAAQIKARLDDNTLDPRTRQALTREAFDAELSAALNQYYLAETMLATGAKAGIERDDMLEKARARFAELAKGPPTSRTVWVARAWAAEILGDQGKPNEMLAEFTAILNYPRLEAEDGKRLVWFFQLRRSYLEALEENTPGKLSGAEQQIRAWLNRFGSSRAKPTQEVIAARYYHAYILQRMATNAIAGMKPDPDTGAIKLPATARRQFEDAERLYRALSQSDHDYTARSTQNRMVVVRRLIGEADKPADEYATFETAQMAALIQMAKMNDAEKAAERLRAAEDDAAPFWAGLRQKAATYHAGRDGRDRKFRVIALLERARELATDKDTPADVTDNLLRLVYFYQLTGQPHQAAVLGEHIARTIRSTGGKSAVAGLLALNGYISAASKIKTDASDPSMAEAAVAAAASARKADRTRAIQVARLLDEKYPNDTATDTARHRLAILYLEDGKASEAFETVVKIRPGYSAILSARQLEGYLAAVLASAKDGVPAQRKVEVFRRAVGDLSRVAKPAPNAPEDDVSGYLSCKLRLAQLLLSQSRVDPETEKTPEARGFVRAAAIADEVVAAVPGFEALNDKEKKEPTLEGQELVLQGLDVRARARYLQAKTLADASDFAGANKTVEEAAADISKPLYDARMREWTGSDTSTPEGAQKVKIAGLASGVDKARRDVVMVGFKLRCVQGDTDGAAKMLDLLKSAGGGIETNQSSLELMARELAAQIPELRREGKAKEADVLGKGLSILLKEFTTLKELPVPTILFLGQTFYTVGQHDDALKEFQKIKPPSQPDWATRKLEEYPQEIRGQLSKEIREYRFAQLYIAKCLRGAGKFPEAEKMLRTAIGNYPPEYPNQGYAYTSIDFRKELAALHEAKGASIPEPKAANPEWGKALREWTTLVAFAQNGMKNITPETPREEVRRVRSIYFDAYFEIPRVLVEANKQLIKDPAKLAASYESAAKKIYDLENVYKFVELEKKGEGVVTEEVWDRYHDLLEKNPPLMAAYKAGGGKYFLEKPKN